MVRASISMNVSIRQAVRIIIIHIVLIRQAPMNVGVTLITQWEVRFKKYNNK